MKGSIILSCGHEDLRKIHGFLLYLRDEACDAIDGFTPAISGGSYCSNCAADLIKNRPEDVWVEYWQAEEEVFE